MTPAETDAVLTISILAAFADGDKHERERGEIRRIADGLSPEAGGQVSKIYQDVLMKRTSLEVATRAIGGEDAKQLAYEMAVCVCDADGAHTAAEQRFLVDLRDRLGLDARAAAHFEEQAGRMAEAPLAPEDRPPSGPGDATPLAPLTPSGAAAAAASALPSPVNAGAMPGVVRPIADDTVLDDAILKAAITNGALELLPETLSTMAIIPLQMRLVYRIGQSYGYELDRGHIKDFLATAGVGLTSQYLEQAGRKLLGGLLGRVPAAGGLLRGVGNQAVSSGMSFASTWALGQVAKRYYAGGRTFSTQMLKDTYASLAQEAQGLQTRYLPAMREEAKTLDAGRVMDLVRGRASAP